MKLLLVLLAVTLKSVAEGALSGSVNSGDCVCSTTNTNARDKPGLSSNVVTVLSTGSCGKIYGGELTTDGYKWYEITYGGQRVWVAGNYLSASSAASCSGSSGGGGGCPKVHSRSEWGARAPNHISYQSHPARYAFIHHAEGSECHSFSSCASLVRGIQNYHMNDRGWSDVGYSFLIGGDGSVFEGRGWDHIGAHTSGHNSEGFGFCFLGSFMTHTPSTAQLNAAKQIIQCGVSKGKLSSNYILRGHRDMSSTDCPGDRLYAIIRGWPHY